MNNLIRFPARPRPQPVAPCDELMLLELEIELARARIAQVRSETRLSNTIWFWLCFRKAVFWLVVLWLLAMVAGVAHAQSTTRSYYGSNGSFAGSSTTRGNSSTYYGPNGQFEGTAIRRGSSSTYYDGQGRYLGSSTSTGPRR